VTGAGVTGAGVTGAGVTGAGVTGAGVTGATAADLLSSAASQAVFRVLLDALAGPGRVLALPAPGVVPLTLPARGPALGPGPGIEPPALPALGPGPGIVPLALAVIGTPVAVLGDPAWQDRICRATGATAAAAPDASLVAVYGTADPADIRKLRRGSALAPEDGAKVGLACRQLTEGGPGEVTVELSGPGVPGRRRLGVDGVGPAVFEALAEANALLPAGIDVWLVDDRGQVAGLPRSTTEAVV
jgi:alpha-D-ribose 1-methylphosphonate 5-triphosphate synthase subunit PhnH